ncbi:hypothetical protein BT96DRAFT_1020242 [Gymnopus androsaceus JB14]|uniref:Uncharacterized protein n=1 Tax=Gymnopus androsaceus JB14 TaxID=1447944 RepID=A0A6A4HI80_9AGAR|nr:hypothetical protein BT96DRAFT_1020242 [Gymnopus androsaceus JB14]
MRPATNMSTFCVIPQTKDPISKIVINETNTHFAGYIHRSWPWEDESGHSYRAKRAPLTYIDEDWAKDQPSTSCYIAQLPPKIIPQPPPPPHPHPRSRSRIKPRSKSMTKANPSIMSALLEEDEDRESAHRKSQASLYSSASACRATSQEQFLRLLFYATSYAPPIPSSGMPGFTSLTLPRAPQPAFTPNSSSKRVSVIGGADGKIDLTKSGIAQTTMATVEVTKGLAISTGATSYEGPRSFRSRKAGTDAVLSFTSYRQPPDYIPSGSVSVQVWAVAVDGDDAKLSGVVTSRVRRNWDWNFSSAPRANVSVRSKHKRSESDDSGRSLGGQSRIEPDVGYIPGRSFFGRILECGWDVKDQVAKKGEWVCGALQEFIVVDRHRVHRTPHPPSISALADSSISSSSPYNQPQNSYPSPNSSSPSTPNPRTPSRANSLARPGRPTNLNLNPPLTLDEYALLPLCGVFAYRAVRILAYAFGKPLISSVDPFAQGPSTKHIDEHHGSRRRALVLRGHDGVGAMAVQMLEGSEEERVYMESVERRVRRWGAEEVVSDDGGSGSADGEGEDSEGAVPVVRIIERLVGDGDVFDAVLDTVGEKEIWEASERLLRNAGVSASHPQSAVSRPGLKRGLSLRKNKDPGAAPAVQGTPSQGTGQFTTLVGDFPGRPIPIAGDHFKAGLRSMKNTHTQITAQDGTAADDLCKKGGRGRVGHAWVSIGQDVDWEGEDVRDSVAAVLKMAVNEGVRPWAGENTTQTRCSRVVPFERTPQIFVADGPLGNGGTAVVKLVE